MSEYINVKCPECKEIRKLDIHQTEKPNFTGICKKCNGKKGAKNFYGIPAVPNYQEKKTDWRKKVEKILGINYLYQDTKYRKIRNEILKDKCSKCGSINNLLVHHILPVETNPELYYEPSNMVTLCNSCHTSYHKYYKDHIELINQETLDMFYKGIINKPLTKNNCEDILSFSKYINNKYIEPDIFDDFEKDQNNIDEMISLGNLSTGGLY